MPQHPLDHLPRNTIVEGNRTKSVPGNVEADMLLDLRVGDDLFDGQVRLLVGDDLREHLTF